MTKVKGPSDFVDAYAKWATSSIDAWAASASAMAAKVQAGSYSPADLIADAALWAGLTYGAAYDTCEAFQKAPAREEVESEEFSVSASTQTRSLRLKDPLVAMMTGAVIPLAKVKIVPDQLAAPKRTFTLKVDATGLPGDAYWGKVQAYAVTATSAAPLEEVRVLVMVP